jgi:phosphoesterase RecJ-like protein
MYPEAKEIKKLVDAAKKIVIIQADNPDADSLGSALALEDILGEMDKDTYLYCGVDMPSYLRYMSGWDRVSNHLPSNFDLSIIVDASTMTLLEKITESNQVGSLKPKPCIVLDHHEIVENQIPFETVKINDFKGASAGQLIYKLAKQLDWPLRVEAQEFIMSSILGDTQGLSNSLASPETYRIMAHMIDDGVDRPALEEKRREYSKMPEDIFKYKGKLIERATFASDGQIAYVIIDQDEINKYSPLYNPAPLIQGDMLLTEKVKIAIVFKTYASGKLTAAIRSNQGAPVANKLAEAFNGGGHSFASGFKQESVKDAKRTVNDVISKASELLGLR